MELPAVMTVSPGRQNFSLNLVGNKIVMVVECKDMYEAIKFHDELALSMEDGLVAFRFWLDDIKNNATVD